MKTPWDNDLKKAYEAFTQDHDHLRRRLMDSLVPTSKQHKQINPVDSVRDFIGDSIMRNRITKLATVTVIAIAVMVGIKGFNGTIAWAEVVKAINDTNDICVSTRVTLADGEISESKSWLKNRTMLRRESATNVIIDDGENRLVLDLEDKTAQTSDSHASFRTFMGERAFEILLLFSGQETRYQATELPRKHTDTMRVFEISYPEKWKGQAWVDARTNLPMRISAIPSETFRDQVSNMEMTFDYRPILSEKFRLVVPSDFTELPRIEFRALSGKVVGENGEPVAGADVVTSGQEILPGKTNQNGAFYIGLPPSESLKSLHLPLFIRAFKADNPHRVAWTVIRNPRQKPKPFRKNSTYEWNEGLTLFIWDEKKLRPSIPPDPGRIVFEDGPDGRPIEVRDMILNMRPAVVITGRVTDRAGRPIANAVVWIEQMDINVSGNVIDIEFFGNTAQENSIISSLDPVVSGKVDTKVFVITDADGRYSLSHIPNERDDFLLKAWAKGMALGSREVEGENVVDFTLVEEDITNRER